MATETKRPSWLDQTLLGGFAAAPQRPPIGTTSPGLRGGGAGGAVPSAARPAAAAAAAAGGPTDNVAEALVAVWNTQAYRFKTNLEQLGFDQTFIQTSMSGISSGKSRFENFKARYNDDDFLNPGRDAFVAAAVRGAKEDPLARTTFAPPDKKTSFQRILGEMQIPGPGAAAAPTADAISGITMLIAVSGYAVHRKETAQKSGMLSDEDRLTSISLVLLASLGLSTADSDTSFPRDGLLYQAALEPMLADANERAFGWHDPTRYGPLLERNADLVQTTLLAAAIGLNRLENKIRASAGGTKAAKAWSSVFASRLTPDVWESAADEKTFTDVTTTGTRVAQWPELRSNDIAAAAQQAQQGQLLPFVAAPAAAAAAAPAGAPSGAPLSTLQRQQQQQLATLFAPRAGAAALAQPTVASGKPSAVSGVGLGTVGASSGISGVGQVMPSLAQMANDIIAQDAEIQNVQTEAKRLTDASLLKVQNSGAQKQFLTQPLTRWVADVFTEITTAAARSDGSADDANAFLKFPSQQSDPQAVEALINAYVAQSLRAAAVKGWYKPLLDLGSTFIENSTRWYQHMGSILDRTPQLDFGQIQAVARSGGAAKILVDDMKAGLVARSSGLRVQAGFVSDTSQFQIKELGSTTAETIIDQGVTAATEADAKLMKAETQLQQVARLSDEAQARGLLEKTVQELLPVIQLIGQMALVELLLLNQIRSNQADDRDDKLQADAQAWIAALAARGQGTGTAAARPAAGAAASPAAGSSAVSPPFAGPGAAAAPPIDVG